MTLADILRMAREEGWSDDLLAETLAFEIQVAVAAEREACAKVAEGGSFLHDDSPEARFGKACAKAIRARGEKP